MKKTIAVIVVMLFVVSMAQPSYAAGLEKLKGGAVKLVKSPLQIKEGIVSEYDIAKFKPLGILGGLLKGLFYTGKDIVSGAIDIVTFPVDLK